MPETLLGAGGARVRCPNCQQLFVVSAQGEVARGTEDLAPAGPPVAPVAVADEPAAPRVTSEPQASPAAAVATAATPGDPVAIARQVLDELEHAHGDAIGQAIQRGRLFSEQGDRLLEAFDEFRRRTQRRADAGPFREMLRERWGVDLTPHWDER